MIVSKNSRSGLIKYWLPEVGHALTSRVAFTLAVLMSVVVSSVKGWSGLHSWAMSNWEISYDFGFFKRGLLGTLTRPLLDSGWLGWNRTDWVLVVGSVLLVLFGMLVVWLTLQAGRQSGGKTRPSRTDQLILLALLVSPLMVMASNLVGYLDYAVYLLGAGAIGCALQRKYLIATGLLLVAILIHEAALFVGYPIAVLTIIFQQARLGRHSLLFWKWPGAAQVMTLAPLLVLGWIFYTQSHFEQSDALRTYLLQRCEQDLRLLDFRPSKIYPGAEHMVELIMHSFDGFWQEELSKGLQRLKDTESLVVFGPLLAWLLLATLAAMVGLPFRLLLSVLLVLASLAPLLMHLIAFDTNRIWLMPVVNLLFARWVVQNYQQRPAGLLAELLTDLGAIVLIVAYSVLTPIVMVDELILTLYFYDYVIWYALTMLVAVSIFIGKYYPLVQAGKLVLAARTAQLD
ncbi:hypothetical protein [Candidatus Thalassolituus haligoni]|uniref:hypothetical protein n=1 Tax=Candidatus Thalassolituus haligoni TaxID=3100113 RepID=UPI0035180AB8